MVGEPQSSVAAEVVSPWPATWNQQAAGYREAGGGPGRMVSGVTGVVGVTVEGMEGESSRQRGQPVQASSTPEG